MNKYFRWILLLPNLWLIYHIFSIGYDAIGVTPVNSTAFTFLTQLGALTEFKRYRNMLYVAYGMLLLIVALQTKKNTRLLPPSQSMMIHVSDIIVSLLLTTFSYALAAMILDVIFLFR